MYIDTINGIEKVVLKRCSVFWGACNMKIIKSAVKK